MNIEKELDTYRHRNNMVPEEQKICETVEKSMQAFYCAEEQEKLSYVSFFWIQIKIMSKKWWGLQAILLLGMWELLFMAGAEAVTQRGMSVVATLFILLIIPEFWKNRETGSLEIESVSFYSIKQIYAVRLIAFGLMDVFLLTIFCVVTTATQAIEIVALLKQLVFPMVVVAAICFSILGSKYRFHEVVAIAGCILTSGIWTVIVMNEKIYAAITPAVWIGIFMVALAALLLAIRNVLHNCNREWEVKSDGIEIG